MATHGHLILVLERDIKIKYPTQDIVMSEIQ